MVSWPARKSVRASSRICLSDIARSFFVLCEKQHGEKVAFIFFTGAALGDDSVDSFVQKIAGFFKSANRREGEFFDPFGKWHQHHVEQDHDLRKRGADVVGFGGDVGAEQRFRDHGEREPHHLAGHVEFGAVGPFFAGVRGAFHHRRGVANQAIAMKRRLD